MNEDSQLRLESENWLSIGEAAKYLRVSKDTLRRWEKEKILKAYRSPTNRRYYRKEDLEYIFIKKPELEEQPPGETSLASPHAKKESRLSLVTISLLSIYIVLMIFLAWLLLQSQ